MQDYTEINRYIKKKYKKDNFYSVSENNIWDILRYVRDKKLDIMFYEKRGYDLIKKHFFVYAYEITNDNSYLVCSWRIVEHNFDNFQDFHSFLRGEIYDKSCYFGYTFSDEEIFKYSINIKKLNFNSLSKKRITAFTLDSLSKKENDSNEQYLQKKIRLKEWFCSIQCPTSYEDFISLSKLFNKHYKYVSAQESFLCMMMDRFGDNIRQFILDMFCKKDLINSLSIFDILFRYGAAAGEYIVNNYKCSGSHTTLCRHKTRLNNSVKISKSNQIKLTSKSGRFCRESQLYIVISRYDIGELHFFVHRYYFDFDDFVNELDGDLSDCDLKYCTEPTDRILAYKTNENTVIPSCSNDVTYSIDKKYSNGKFLVIQKWCDANGSLILSDQQEFRYFFDFLFFLKNDLSNADLLMCEGIENISSIPGIVLTGAKLRSDIAVKLGISVNKIDELKIETQEFSSTDKFELSTISNYEVSRELNYDYPYEIGYATDIHLVHRIKSNKCKSYEDCEFVFRKILATINAEACNVNLIGGDIASDISFYERFIDGLEKCNGHYFITLGNHELWKNESLTYDQIINKYKDILHRENIHFVHNNLFMLVDGKFVEIATTDLISIDCNNLRKIARKASLIIFGGIGFSGYNNDFNATNGIYREAVSREKEIEFSNNFGKLYKKIVQALFDKNVVVLTHMPLEDWLSVAEYHKGFVYVNGHNHRNRYFDDNEKRLFSDNQIGYHQKEVHLKKLTMNIGYNWFQDVVDGIHEITREDYIEFYRGLREGISFNRSFQKIYMLKKEGVYMFLMLGDKGGLSILNGGSLRKAFYTDLNYYYKHLVNYSKSINLFLSRYTEYQKTISMSVKAIGGKGTIHGSIVDIDFFNHIYINPLDGTITPYFANSMVDKRVYKNLPSLLHSRCPELFARLNDPNIKNELLLLNNNVEISDDYVYVYSTDMYKISRILKGLQFNTNFNVVRYWNDMILSDCNAEIGKEIVAGLLDFGDRNE